MQCLRALYEANSTCALAKTNDGSSVEDLILNNVIFSLEDENALDNWNEVQAIFMRDSRLSIEKLVLRIQEMHEVGAGEEPGKLWSNLTRIFEPLLQDYFDGISALLGSVLTTLLTVYVSTYKVFADVENLVDLLCSIIDAMASTQLETLRVNKRQVLNLVLSSGEPRLISCLVGKNLDVDARDEDVLSQNAVQLACLCQCDLTSFRLKRDADPRWNRRQLPHSRFGGEIEKADGAVRVLQGDLSAIRTELAGPALRGQIQNAARRGACQAPNVQPLLRGIRDRQAIAIGAKGKPELARAIAGHAPDFGPIARTPQFDRPSPIGADVTLQLCVEYHPGPFRRQPFLGNAQVGECQGGDCLVS